MNQQIPEELDLVLLEIIPCGRASARTGRELVKLIRQTRPDISLPTNDPARIIRHAVQGMRLDRVPICADTQNGYYLPTNYQQAYAYYKQLVHRAKELWQVAKSFERFLRHWRAYEAGQVVINEETGQEEAPFECIPEKYRYILLRRIGALVCQQQTPHTPTPQQQCSSQPSEQSCLDEIQPLLKEAIRLTNASIKMETTLDMYTATVRAHLMRLVSERLHHPLPLTYLKRCNIDKHTLKQMLQSDYEKRMQLLKSQKTLEVE